MTPTQKYNREGVHGVLEKEVLFTIVGDPQGDLHHLGAQADNASNVAC